jgi:hypothetical protein
VAKSGNGAMTLTPPVTVNPAVRKKSMACIKCRR